MVLFIIRAIFVLAVLAIAVSYAQSPDISQPNERDPDTHEEIGLSVITKVTLVLVIPVVLAVAVMLADTVIHNKSLTSISGLFFGLVAGVVLAFILGLVVDLVASVFMPETMEAAQAKVEAESPTPAAGPRQFNITTRPDGGLRISYGDAEGDSGATSRPAEAAELARAEKEAKAKAEEAERRERVRRRSGQALVAMIKLLVGACSIFLCVSFIMQTKDDFRFVIPYLEFSKETKGQHPFLLDTSVIIDGRIADIGETRILESPLIVPRFVLEELQDIADSADKLKRNRGRRGLDMLNRLQSNEKIDIRLVEARIDPVEEVSEVDHKLVAFAQHLDGRIVTNDYNLNKVAQLRGVEVININDLANALKPVVLPGEALTVKIIKPGEEMGQGVGYLDDGTMVVAEQGREFVGRDMTLVVTSTLQTSAGRMIFGRPASDKDHPGPTRDRTT